MLDILFTYHEAFLKGLTETVTIAGIVWSVGIFLGLTLSYLLSRETSGVRLPHLIRMISFTVANIPVIIILMWCYYPLQMVTGINLSGSATTIIVLVSLNTIGVSDLALEAMRRFPPELAYSAELLGVTEHESYLWIKIPVVLREIIPAIINLQISMLHMTLFGSLLSADELFRTSQRIISQTYTPVAVYSVLALFFLVVGAGLQLLIVWWKRRTRFFAGSPL